MKSVVELEINAPQAKVAELFADPRTFPEWMEDVARIEPVAESAPTLAGRVYRIVPKNGRLAFVARVVRQEPPFRSRLALRSPKISVDVTGRFVKLSERRTKLVAKNVFSFRGLNSRLLGLLGRREIRRMHHRHMESFKRFAEAHA
jgi:Polyketide cyclase / dehydrase and lipid transport